MDTIPTDTNDNLFIAIKAALLAGREILKIYEQPVIEVVNKEDNSPLTLADKASNDKIITLLNTTPYPIISEESKQLAYAERKNWEIYWIVDPLDGTKEFIKKNGEFTVNIALCANGSPILGVIYVPVSRELYYSNVEEKKAYKMQLDKEYKPVGDFFNDTYRIYPSEHNRSLIKIVGSSSHMNRDTLSYIEAIKKDHKEVEIVAKGSSLKFCLVAEGKADLYPRFAPTMEWDTAAGHAICNAVGLKVISRESNSELQYNKSNLLNPYFLVSN